MKKENNMTAHQIDQLLAKSVEVEQQNVIISELKADKLFLSKDNERLVNELKDSDKPTSRVEIGERDEISKYDHKLDRYVVTPTFTPITVTSDLEEVKNKIKKIITEDTESNIAKLENSNKTLNKVNKELFDDMHDYKESQYKIYEKKANRLEEEYAEYKDNKRKVVAELTKELEKERNNKTDAELATKRKEEIKSLKVRISDLEIEVKQVLGLGFWKRQWYKLTNIPALAKAKETVITRERVAAKVSYEPFRLFGMNIW